MIGFLKSRKRYLLVSLVSAAGFLTFFVYLSRNWILVMTASGQECFPYRHWVVKKTRDVHAREFVAFRGHGIPNTIAGNFRKIILVSGDLVKLTTQYKQRFYFVNDPIIDLVKFKRVPVVFEQEGSHVKVTEKKL